MTAVALVLAGCGSSGSSKPSARVTTPTTVPPTAPNTPQQLAADRALARHAVLRLSDLPTGYVRSKDQSDNSSSDNTTPAQARQFASCAHLSPALAKELLSNDPPPGDVEVQSKDFELDSSPLAQVTISGTVDIARSPETVLRILTIVDSAKRTSCWERLLRQTFATSGSKGQRIDGLAVESLGSMNAGDHSGGVRIRVTVTEAGFSIPVVLDIVVAQRGRMVVSLVMNAAGIATAPQRATERSLLQKMLDRLDA